LGDPRAVISVSCCDKNAAACTGVDMSVAVSRDCGRVLVVPATRDMFMLGREGSAKERAKEEKEGNVEVEVEPEVPDSPSRGGGGSCFGGGIDGGGWPSAFAQASRALCSS
jgi:hypothetical protein